MSDSTKIRPTTLGRQVARVTVEGIPLGDLVKMPGPLLTCYLHAGSNPLVRLNRAIAERSEISERVADVARNLCPEEIREGAVCIVANPTCPGVIFQMNEPVALDAIRYGSVPSLGLLVESMADDVVGDSRSQRSDFVADELSQFIAAREAGTVVEEIEVIDAIRSGLVASVLVHDDPTDNRLLGSDRLVDLITSTALLNGVPLTIIPSLPRQRGPRGGVGAILAGAALDRSINRKIVEAVSQATARVERVSEFAQRGRR